MWSDRVENSKYHTENSGLRADRGYVGHKSAKMMKRSKVIEARQQEMLEEKRGLLHNIDTADNLKIMPLVYHTDCLVLLKNISIFYDETAVCQNIGFEIRRGDRIALCGKNGSGKSSLIKLLCGENITYTGDVHIGSRLKISYVSQDTSFLIGSMSEYAHQKEIDEALFKAILRKLDFSREQFKKDMSCLSEGQKKKILIAASLCEKAHLYIWDEPLNFIDVLSREQIEELLLESCPTLLFVEHDDFFRERIATHTVDLSST